MRQLVYIIFIISNHAPFHVWLKENLVKSQKVLKYYVQDCVQNFLLFFMCLLTAPIVKNRHILAGIYFIFLTNVLDESLPIPNLDLSEMIGKVVIKEDKIWHFFAT